MDVVACSISGERYEIQGARGQLLGTYSGTVVTHDELAIPVRAHDAATVLGTLEDIYLAEWLESFDESASGHRIRTGRFEVVNPGEGQSLGYANFAMWTDGNSAVWCETDRRSADFLAEFLVEARIETMRGCPYLSGLAKQDMSWEAESVLISFAEFGALECRPYQGGPERPRGRPVPAGDMFEISDRTGNRRPVLASNDVFIESAVLDVSFPEAVTWFSSLTSLRYEATGPAAGPGDYRRG